MKKKGRVDEKMIENFVRMVFEVENCDLEQLLRTLRRQMFREEAFLIICDKQAYFDEYDEPTETSMKDCFKTLL